MPLALKNSGQFISEVLVVEQLPQKRRSRYLSGSSPFKKVGWNTSQFHTILWVADFKAIRLYQLTAMSRLQVALPSWCAVSTGAASQLCCLQDRTAGLFMA